MAGATRIKVKTADLIARLEELRAEKQKAHDKAVADYPAAQKEWADKVRKEAERVASMTDAELIPALFRAERGERVIFKTPKAPINPNDEHDYRNHKSAIEDIDRHLRVLRMTADETVTIGPYDGLINYL